LLGLFLARSLITGYIIADGIVPANSRTEASTWINTAVNVGASSLAAGVAGVIIDGAEPWLPLLLAGSLVIVAAAAVPFRQLRAIEEQQA
jgi:hypothetical protein